MRKHVLNTCLFLNLCLVHLALRAQQPESGPATRACDNSCSCASDYSPAGVMVSHLHDRGEWMFSYRYMGMFMQDIRDNGKPADETVLYSTYLWAPRDMQMHMHMLMGMYGISDRLTAMVMSSYQASCMHMDMFAPNAHHHDHGSAETGNGHFMKSAGISDTKLQLMYGVIRQNNHRVMLTGGISIPTGSINRQGKTGDMMYAEERMPYMMQTGSGTWDVMPGICYTGYAPAFSWSFQTGAVLRYGSNKYNYRLGNALTTTVWVARKWNNWFSQSLRMQFTRAASVQGRDVSLYAYNEPSANPVNYGGSCLQALGGFSFSPGGCMKNNRFSLEAGCPVYQCLNGVQLNTTVSWYAGWNFMLK